MVRVVEINIAIIVACSSCFPAFLTKMKVFSSTFYRSLRTRIFGSRYTYNELSGPSRGQGSNIFGTKNKSKTTDINNFNVDQVELRALPNLAVRDKNKYVATNTVSGEYNDSNGRFTYNDTTWEKNQPGIRKAVR